MHPKHKEARFEQRVQEEYEKYVKTLYQRYEEEGKLTPGYEQSPDDPRDHYDVKSGRPNVDYNDGLYYNGRNLMDKTADSLFDMMEATQKLENNHLGAVLGRLFKETVGVTFYDFKKNWEIPSFLKPLKHLVVNRFTVGFFENIGLTFLKIDKTMDKIGLGPLSLYKRTHNLISHLWPDTANDVLMEKVNEHRGDSKKFHRYLMNEGLGINDGIIDLPEQAQDILMGMLEFNGMLLYSKQHLNFADLDPSMKKFVLTHIQMAETIQDGPAREEEVALKIETYLTMQRKEMRDSTRKKIKSARAKGKDVFALYDLVNKLKWDAGRKISEHSTHLLGSSTEKNENAVKEHLQQYAEFPAVIGAMAGWIDGYTNYGFYLNSVLNPRLNHTVLYGADDGVKNQEAYYTSLDRRPIVVGKSIFHDMPLLSENLEKPVSKQFSILTANHTLTDVGDGLSSILPWLKTGHENRVAYHNEHIGLNFIYRDLYELSKQADIYKNSPNGPIEAETLLARLTDNIKGARTQLAQQDKLNISSSLEKRFRKIDGYSDYLPKGKLSWADVITAVGQYGRFAFREDGRASTVDTETGMLGPTDENVLTRAYWQNKKGAHIRKNPRSFAVEGDDGPDYQQFEGYMILLDEEGQFVYTEDVESNGRPTRAVSWEVLEPDDVKECRKRIIKGIETFGTDKENVELREYFWNKFIAQREAGTSFSTGSITNIEASLQGDFQQFLNDFIADEYAVNPLTDAALNPEKPQFISDELISASVFGHGDRGSLEPLPFTGHYLGFDLSGKRKGSTLGKDDYPIYDFVRDEDGEIVTCYGYFSGKKIEALYEALRANDVRLHNVEQQDVEGKVRGFSSTANVYLNAIEGVAQTLRDTKAKDIQDRGRARSFMVASPQPKYTKTEIDPTTNKARSGLRSNRLMAASVMAMFNGPQQHFERVPGYFRDRQDEDSVYQRLGGDPTEMINFSEQVLINKTKDDARLLYLPKDENGNPLDLFGLAKIPITDRNPLFGWYDTYTKNQDAQNADLQQKRVEQVRELAHAGR